jgi:hypothetical protein
MTGDLSRWCFDHLLPRWIQREVYYMRTPKGCVDWPSLAAFKLWQYERNRWWRRALRWVFE